MIDKIVHFSDLHIKLYKDHDLYRDILKECFQKWSALKPDRIVFTGDLVHSKNHVTPELIDMVSWVLRECSNIAKTIVLIGNHDFLENNLDRLDTLTPIINNLNYDNIVYFTDKGIYEDENVRWCVYSLKENNERPDIPTEKDKWNIGLYHGTIQGLSTDMGHMFDEGTPPEHFDGCDVVLAGDIHKRQVVEIPKGKLYMIGSLIQQNFGESLKNHGFGVYNVSENKYEFEDVDNYRPYLNFKIKDIEDIEKEREKLTNK